MPNLDFKNDVTRRRAADLISATNRTPLLHIGPRYPLPTQARLPPNGVRETSPRTQRGRSYGTGLSSPRRYTLIQPKRFWRNSCVYHTDHGRLDSLSFESLCQHARDRRHHSNRRHLLLRWHSQCAACYLPLQRDRLQEAKGPGCGHPQCLHRVPEEARKGTTTTLLSFPSEPSLSMMRYGGASCPGLLN